MKQILWLIMLLAVPAVLAYDVPGSSGYEGPLSGLYVTTVSYDPSPVSPGDVVDVWLKVENRGQQDVPDAYVSVHDQFPFTSVDAGTQHVGKLLAGQASVVAFKVKLDPTASSGNATLHIYLQRTSTETPEEQTIRLQVRRLDAVLAIDAVTTAPDPAIPGTPTRVDVTVHNNADTALRSIKASLDLTDSELPFTPLGTGIEKTLATLAPGASETLSFTLVPDPDAESKPYRIPLLLTYYDATGSNRTRSEIVGIIVGAEPELGVYIDSTELTSAQTTGNLIVKFVNRGVSNIKFLTVRLQQTDEYVIVNSPENYIGKVDSDDYETAEFQLALTNKADDTVELPLVMEYRDGNNKEYSNGVSLTLVRHTPSQLGAGGSGFGTVIIVLLVLGIVGWFAWKRKWFRRR